MQQIKNALFCQQFVLPKIVMSHYNIKDNMNSCDDLDETELKESEDLEICNCDLNSEKVKFLNKPEITCSPSPCVFDDCIRKPKDHRLSPSRSYGSRSPSPDTRRRSPSPFRRSPSPSSRRNGSRRGSTTPTGYEMYQKSLLEVPIIHDYGDASSDDLSSEWDSDVPEAPKEQPKVVFKSKICE